MAFDSFGEFLHMQGHGGYVFAAYALTALALLYNALAPGVRRRRLARQLAQQRARQLAARSDQGPAAAGPPP